MEEDLQRIWRRPIDETPVYKDLPRLAGRIEIESLPKLSKKKPSRAIPSLRISQEVDGQSKMVEACDKLQVIEGEPGNPGTPEPSEPKVWRQVKKAILGVAIELEDADRLQEIRTGLDKFGSYTADMEIAVRELFEKVVGVDSKTARVFKAIHQNILFVGVFELKDKVAMGTMTKDVRGPEGWRILVSFGQDSCSVTHTKREEALATAPKSEQFWFEWQLHMTFDKNVSDLHAASLKVTNLVFGEETRDSYRQELSRLLCAGKLFIS